jgi:4-amino-4-deoxy-L-arabinose transferase-like glycosyltransferase
LKIEGLDFSLVTNYNSGTQFGSRVRILLILLVFFIFLLPALSRVSTYHSDEFYYTDSAIYMLLHQDYLNPHYADGSLRAKKPIITYWALIAGYALLGINFFAARLPFLVAGCITLGLTYRMAVTLMGSRRLSLLAAAILTSNLQFIILCLRATPDILNTLFLNISLYGFMMLIFAKDQRLRHYIYAYCGAALAIETKGMLGITPVIFAFLFILVSKDPDIRFRHLINWPVIGLSTMFAVSWYAFILVHHGQDPLLRFYTDQVGSKLGGSRFYILLNIKEYVFGIFLNFFPWSLILISGYAMSRRQVYAFIGAHKRRVAFISSWFGLIFVIFMFSNDCRVRYLVPAYPLLSVMFAAIFGILVEHKHIARLWKWCSGLLLVLIACSGVVALLGGAVMDGRLVILGLILLGASLPALLRWIRYKRVPEPVWIGLSMLIALAGYHGFGLPVFEFAPSEQLTACILRNVAEDQSITVWATRRQNYTRQVYLLSKGRISMHYFPRKHVPEDLNSRSPVILTARDKETLSLGEYDVEACGYVFHPPQPEILWQAIRRGEKEAALNSMRDRLYLAWRRNGNGPEDGHKS